VIRTTFCLLLVCATTLAQEDLRLLVDRIYLKKTLPTPRIALITEVLATERGPDALAQRLLDDEVDEEALHAVVEGYFLTRKYNGHLGRICQLLLVNDAKRGDMVLKVRNLIRSFGVDPTVGPELRMQLRFWALGAKEASKDDPVLRRAAVKALGAIEHRETLEAIVAVWKKEAQSKKGGPVAAECRDAVAEVIPRFDEASSAQAYLEMAPRHMYSYSDFVREQVRIQQRKNRQLAGLFAQAMRDLFRVTEDTQLVLKYLASWEPDSIRGAALRLQELASAQKIDPEHAAAVATGVLEAIRKQLENPRVAPETLAALSATLVGLLEDPKLAPKVKEAAPPKTVTALFDDIASGVDSKDVGSAAVAVLTVVNLPEAVTKLDEIARTWKSAEVRGAAIVALGAAAVRDSANRRYVGEKLAALLATETDSNNRASLLSTLARGTPPATSLAPAAKQLREFQADELSSADFDCIAILARIRDSEGEARAALLDLATNHASLALRAAVIERGILGRGYAGADAEKAVLERVAALIANPEDPVAFRAGIVTSMGARGRRTVAPFLEALESAEDTPKELLAAGLEARWTLADRLVSGADPTKIAPEDFEVAVSLLARLPRTKPGPRMKGVAQKVITAGAALKAPVRSARYLCAWAQDVDKADPAAVLRYYGEACDQAKADRLPVEEERIALRRYIELLVAVKAPTPAQIGRLAKAHERHAVILEAAADTGGAAGERVNAAEMFLKLKDPAGASRNTQKAKALAPENVQLKPRIDAVERALAAQIPPTPPKSGS